MRRKSKTPIFKFTFLGYMIVAAGVIVYGWWSRPEPDPYADLPVMQGSTIIRVPADVELEPSETATPNDSGQKTLPEDSVNPIMANETVAPSMEQAPSEPAGPAADDLRLDDLRLPGASEPDEVTFEVVEPNPYLVTD